MTIIKNRSATYNFEIVETYIAGIKLLGEEVKSLRSGHGNLSGSYISELGGELYLVGFNIPRYKRSSNPDYAPKRRRKLLLKKSEISRIRPELNAKGRAVIPLQVFLKDNLFKVEIAVAKGKGGREKKQAIKERQQERDVQRELKDY